MKKELIEGKGISIGILLMLAFVAGFSDANVYYIQPILGLVRDDLQLSAGVTNILPTLTQVGYALGLFFIVPLGDIVKRKNLILISFTGLISSLCIFAFSTSVELLFVASFLIGFCAIMPQIFIPLASQFSRPEDRGRNVGIVLSGILVGIILSRLFSGYIASVMDWTVVYICSAIFITISWIVIYIFLPKVPVLGQKSYKTLMKDMVSLFVSNKTISRSSIRVGFSAASLMSIWAALAFRMEMAPFFTDSSVVGLIGLFGIFGALGAPVIGKLMLKMSSSMLNSIGFAVLIGSWLILYFGQNFYITIILGITTLHIATQTIQMVNQTNLLAIDDKATNSINTLFMTIFIAGASLGTFTAGYAWQFYGYVGVFTVGMMYAVIGMIIKVKFK